MIGIVISDGEKTEDFSISNQLEIHFIGKDYEMISISVHRLFKILKDDIEKNGTSMKFNLDLAKSAS